MAIVSHMAPASHKVTPLFKFWFISLLRLRSTSCAPLDSDWGIRCQWWISAALSSACWSIRRKLPTLHHYDHDHHFYLLRQQPIFSFTSFSTLERSASMYKCRCKGQHAILIRALTSNWDESYIFLAGDQRVQRRPSTCCTVRTCTLWLLVIHLNLSHEKGSART